MTTIVYRPIQISEQPESLRVIQAAFSQDHSGGKYEVQLVEALRLDPHYRPAWEIVAVDERSNRIVGHVMLSTIGLSKNRNQLLCVCVAPLAVIPSMQGQGIGGGLLVAAEKQAKQDGVALISILGDQKYYCRFGYVPAIEYSIGAGFDVPSDYFLVKVLEPKRHLSASGSVKYLPAFHL